MGGRESSWSTRAAPTEPWRRRGRSRHGSSSARGPGYGAQKNHASELASHDWILSIDADERVTPELAAEIRATLATAAARAAIAFPRVTYYLGRWIREHRLVSGLASCGSTTAAPRVEPSPGARVASSSIARPGGCATSSSTSPTAMSLITSRRSIATRRSPRSSGSPKAGAPARLRRSLHPPFAFLRNYILRRGFTDGAAGLLVSALNSYYVFIKLVEAVGAPAAGPPSRATLDLADVLAAHRHGADAGAAARTRCSSPSWACARWAIARCWSRIRAGELRAAREGRPRPDPAGAGQRDGPERRMAAVASAQAAQAGHRARPRSARRRDGGARAVDEHPARPSRRSIAARRVDFHLAAARFRAGSTGRSTASSASRRPFARCSSPTACRRRERSSSTRASIWSASRRRRRRTLHEELWLPTHAPIVGNVAALVPHKGQRHLIDTAALVVQRVPDARFVIAGEGELRPALERQIREQHLEKHVILLGFRPDVLSLHKAFDVFVMSSVTEGLGTSLLDAMACWQAGRRDDRGRDSGGGRGRRDGPPGPAARSRRDGRRHRPAAERCRPAARRWARRVWPARGSVSASTGWCWTRCGSTSASRCTRTRRSKDGRYRGTAANPARQPERPIGHSSNVIAVAVIGEGHAADDAARVRPSASGVTSVICPAGARTPGRRSGAGCRRSGTRRGCRPWSRRSRRSGRILLEHPDLDGIGAGRRQSTAPDTDRSSSDGPRPTPRARRPRTRRTRVSRVASLVPAKNAAHRDG